jgi:S-DNA-T family DNA segregation ATPase FtsK/SpoIIIE
MSTFSGDQLAQVNNPDSFALPVLRSPVWRTPTWLTVIVKLVRLLVLLVRFLVRHPLLDLAVSVLACTYAQAGWPGLLVLVLVTAAVLAVWRWRWPGSFTRFIARPAYGRWRRWHYRRHWIAVMTIAGLAVVFRGRMLMPVLGKVTATRYTDRVLVGLVSGQSAADYADKAENLAHGLKALLCRVRSAAPGFVILEFVRRDALTGIVPALEITAEVDLKALPAGRCEDGSPWLVKLHGTHLLIAGATGAGKGSIIWSLIRAMLPAMLSGLVRVLAADPKVMELAYGRAIFDRHGHYAADPEAIVAMLEAAVTDMQARAATMAGKQRSHTPTTEYPFVVVLVDEVAFLTAYMPDKQLRERVKAALATLTTQGRAVGYCVIAALQDPRKEVMSIRNLFPDRIAMRLDEPEQVDMVLGDGALDRGATAHLISSDPAIGAGVAFVRLETNPDPVRVRASWVSDDDIHAMAALCADPGPDPEPEPQRLAIQAGARA